VIENMLAALKAALDTLMPIHEGFKDIQRTLVSSDSSVAEREVIDAINDYDQRATALRGGITALQALIDNGYPNDVPVVMDNRAAAVIKEQVRTVGLAFAKITVHSDAVTATVVVGAPIPRP